MVKISLKHFLRGIYDLYKVKLLFLWLVVEAYSLWHYIFRYLVLVSIPDGSGPCAYAVLCIATGRTSSETLALTFDIFENMANVCVSESKVLPWKQRYKTTT